MSFLATEIKEDNICSRLNIANYKSCQIWLEGYNSPYTKKLTRLTFHYSANTITPTPIH
jgi:hypothetical protein